jgi:hypothetical protein
MRVAIGSFIAGLVVLASVQAPAQPLRASPFDGQWSGVWSCGTSLSARSQNASAGQPYSTKRTAQVRDGAFEMKSGTPGQSGYRELVGQVSSDGSVSLNGHGFSGGEANRYRIWANGRFQGNQFQGSGGEGDRSCIVELVRDAPRQPPVQSVQAPAPAPAQAPAQRPTVAQQVMGPIYDGIYRGHFECEPRRGSRQSEGARLRREIVISQAMAKYDWIGERVQESAVGRIDPTGKLSLQGMATNDAGQRFGIDITGAVDGHRLLGQAVIADRNCKVDLARVGMSTPDHQSSASAPPQPQPQLQPAAITAFDGTYRGPMSCGPSEAERRANIPGAEAFQQERDVVIQNGSARFARGPEGRANSQFADGKVGPDGRLVVEGRGITQRNVSYPIRFDLDLRNGQATGAGRLGDRACELRLAKDGARVQEASSKAGAEPDGSKALLELALWDAVKGSNDVKLFQDYLKKYPDGNFAAVANARIAELRKPAAASAPAAPPAPSVDLPPELVNEKRLALVIGNADYRSLGKLANPANDAKAMAATLKRLGFAVIEKTNADRTQMSDAIDEFGSKLQAGGVGLFFFAGHGMQVRGQNFLMPVEANPRSEVEVQGKAINATYVLEHMAEARNRVNILVLDACRNNPLQHSAFRSLTRGLAVVGRAPGGTIIAYATAPDAVAEDGDEKNGLYTSELLKHLETPGLKVEDVFKRVTAGVRTRSNGQQVPWTTGSLEGDFYFKLPGRRG